MTLLNLICSVLCTKIKFRGEKTWLQCVLRNDLLYWKKILTQTIRALKDFCDIAPKLFSVADVVALKIALFPWFQQMQIVWLYFFSCKWIYTMIAEILKSLPWEEKSHFTPCSAHSLQRRVWSCPLPVCINDVSRKQGCACVILDT